jgi:long-chain acyl-CoA synthetase
MNIYAGDYPEFTGGLKLPNCTTFIDNNARLGEKQALFSPANNYGYSYRELYDKINNWSYVLTELGILKGDRVGIYLPSIPEYVILYFAIWRVGAVAVPMNIVLKPAEIRYLLEDSGAKLLVTDTLGEQNARKGSLSCTDVSPVSYISIESEEWRRYEEKSLGFFRPADCCMDDLCQLQYTSGTTGRQKGAMLTHGNWIAALDTEREVLALTADDVFLGIYPMAHVGVSWGISALKAGATWIIIERFDPDEYISLAERFSATVLAGMPPVIHSLMKTPDGTEKKLSSAKEMISGGGPLHPGVWKEFHSRFGIPIVNAYGLSETIVVGTGTAIIPGDYESADRYRSVGRPVGYSEVKIVSPEDPATELPADETGEIALRGPGVAKGYWNMPEETAAVFIDDGWFLTGDMGFIDPDGRVSITDRKKDMIVMSGWKIYPTEIEKAMIEHPDIEDIALFGCPDVHRGEIPVAAVVPADGRILDTGALEDFAKSRLAGYKVPRRYIIIDELPRVNGWKLLRKKLRSQYCSNSDWKEGNV